MFWWLSPFRPRRQSQLSLEQVRRQKSTVSIVAWPLVTKGRKKSFALRFNSIKYCCEIVLRLSFFSGATKCGTHSAENFLLPNIAVFSDNYCLGYLTHLQWTVCQYEIVDFCLDVIRVGTRQQISLALVPPLVGEVKYLLDCFRIRHYEAEEAFLHIQMCGNSCCESIMFADNRVKNAKATHCKNSFRRKVWQQCMCTYVACFIEIVSYYCFFQFVFLVFCCEEKCTRWTVKLLLRRIYKADNMAGLDGINNKYMYVMKSVENNALHAIKYCMETYIIYCRLTVNQLLGCCKYYQLGEIYFVQKIKEKIFVPKRATIAESAESLNTTTNLIINIRVSLENNFFSC